MTATVPVQFQLGGLKLSASWVPVIVCVNLGVALEANRDGVVDVAGTSLGNRLHVIELHLNPAKAVADAAPPVALG